MGRAHGTCGEGERYIRGFGGGNMSERDHLEDLGVDGGDNIAMHLKVNLLAVRRLG